MLPGIEKAGSPIPPPFQRLNGVDIAALILAENVERRNLTPGQRAMARAMLTKDVKRGPKTKEVLANLQELSGTDASQMARAMLVKPEQGKRTDLEELPANLPEVSDRSVRMARFVLRTEPELARSVFCGWPALPCAAERSLAENRRTMPTRRIART